MSGVAAIILAAGLGSRFGGEAKPLARFRGAPMLAHVLAAAQGSRARPIIVVTGHDHDAVAAACADQAVSLVYNADYRSGLAGSLKAGMRALPEDCAGALVLLADMPLVQPATLDALIAGAELEPDHAAFVPVFDERRGNPVLLTRKLLPQIEALEGDRGAGPLLRAGAGIREIPVDDPGIHLDADTPQALAKIARE
ncbi:nucleotidyltransferase family protein [Saliniramus sp.]|uniref:nucleotidyltransferase family protein n=1 Tax=Saliniramus sp. TaxID=2986772 RepID=UPI002C85EB78|nr:nucleotidyltransferase family protein [Saliniramus sp.]HMB09984.1 nucleotidyltransferase family protein [Saliniramus sp.]